MLTCYFLNLVSLLWLFMHFMGSVGKNKRNLASASIGDFISKEPTLIPSLCTAGLCLQKPHPQLGARRGSGLYWWVGGA